MRNIYKYFAMSVLVCLTVLGLPGQAARQRMICPSDGKKPYFGVCPGGEEPVPADGATSDGRDDSRPPASSRDCDASWLPGGRRRDCPPKTVVTPAGETTTRTAVETTTRTAVETTTRTAVETTTLTGSLISGRYQDNGDGTVTDVTTQLMWKRCAEGQSWTGSTCAGISRDMSSDEVMPNNQQKSWPAFAGYNDWQVPTAANVETLSRCSTEETEWGTDEFRAMPDEFRAMPDDILKEMHENNCLMRFDLDTQAFPNNVGIKFWSSDQHATLLTVVFSNKDGKRRTVTAPPVHLVRGGQ